MDIDYMDQYRDFTYSKNNFAGLPEYVKDTKAKNNIRWTFIIDPAIESNNTGYSTFDEGYKQDVFIKWPKDVPFDQRHNPKGVPTDKDVAYGQVWPAGPAAFPDFLKERTQKWWVNELKKFHDLLEYDAIWIDMNEPSNFISGQCPISELNIDFGKRILLI